MIAIYRHMKLAFAMHKPDPAYRAPPSRLESFEGGIPEDGGVGLLPGPIELAMVDQMPDGSKRYYKWRFKMGRFKMLHHKTYGTVQSWPLIIRPNPLENLIWAAGEGTDQAAEMIETMSNRTVVESVMLRNHPDAMDYWIIEIDLNRKRDLMTPYAKRYDMRTREQVEDAIKNEPNPENADAWLKLFMGD